jgi:hypothetical protein
VALTLAVGGHIGELDWGRVISRDLTGVASHTELAMNYETARGPIERKFCAVLRRNIGPLFEGAGVTKSRANPHSLQRNALLPVGSYSGICAF